MSGWLNTPEAIVENDQVKPEYIVYLTTEPPTVYKRTVSYLTTRYVGSDYTAAKVWRDALLAAYPPFLGLAGSTIEAVISPAGGGQYHVLATVTTTTAYILQP